MRQRIAGCAVVLWACFQPLPGTMSIVAAAPTGAEIELAKKHFDLGRTYYDQAIYDKALAEFKEAYRLSNKPALLFNVGKCHEALGNITDAVQQYEQYLKDTGTEDDNLRARIENLKRRIPSAKSDSNEATVQKTPAKTPLTPLPSPPEQPAHSPIDQGATITSTAETVVSDPGPDTSRSRWKFWTGWTLTGVGVGAAALGIVFGVAAKSKSDALNLAYSLADSGNGYRWSELESIDSDGRMFQSAMIGSLVAGSVVAISGITLLILERNEPETAVSSTSQQFQLVPTIGAGYAGGAASISF